MLRAYVAPGEGTSPKWCAAFAKGAGCAVQTGGPLRDGDVALFGSPQLESLLNEARRLGRTWFYGDHAFFGRGQFFRCSRNELQFDGSSGDDDPARFAAFNVPIREWSRRGQHIIICPNSERFMAAHGVPNWVDDVCAELRRHTDRELVIRWKGDRKPLREDLRDAWAVVVFTSNAGVEAILAGVPAFATARCAALTKGCGDLSKIETPARPDGRRQWASRLANRQWTMAEMARGDLWKVLGQ